MKHSENWDTHGSSVSRPGLRYPGESPAYRAARNALLDEEVALRRQIERVAAQRRALPSGGPLAEDYEFIGANGKARFSDLFGSSPTLILYSFMFGPDRLRPCPGCTHMLDAINGEAMHLAARVPFYVVARSPLERIIAYGCERGWDRLRFLSAEHNNYSRDYFGNTTAIPEDLRGSNGIPDGEIWEQPMMNVFRRDDSGIQHFWGSELVYAPSEPRQDHRAGDLTDTLWGMLDQTPEGRGDFQPRLNYDQCTEV